MVEEYDNECEKEVKVNSFICAFELNGANGDNLNTEWIFFIRLTLQGEVIPSALLKAIPRKVGRAELIRGVRAVNPLNASR